MSHFPPNLYLGIALTQEQDLALGLESISCQLVDYFITMIIINSEHLSVLLISTAESTEIIPVSHKVKVKHGWVDCIPQDHASI